MRNSWQGEMQPGTCWRGTRGGAQLADGNIGLGRRANIPSAAAAGGGVQHLLHADHPLQSTNRRRLTALRQTVV